MISLHPRNNAFKWQSLNGPFELISSEQAARYDEHGYFLLEGVFESDEISEVANAIDPYERKKEEALRDFEGGTSFIAKADAITFTANLVAQSTLLKHFSMHPVFQKLCRDVIGPTARMYWDQAVYKKPGNPEEFPWHQDNGYTYVEPQQYLTCWVPLVDATEENGCPWVVPGLHKFGTLEHNMTSLGWQCTCTTDNAVAVPAKVGDVVVFSSLTPHRTGPNLTRGTRKAYILQYAPDGIVAYSRGENSPMPQSDPERQYFVAN